MSLRAYIAERLPVRLVAPVASALALAAGGDRTTGQFASDAMLALVLVVQFRLWDDIAERARDAVHHPTRVLVRAVSIRPFEAAAAGLGLVTVAYLISQSPHATALYIALVSVFAVWYGLRRERTAANTCLLLAKYPAFVAIVAATRPIAHPMPLLISLVIVYIAACVYEAWHDPSSLRWGGIPS